MAQVGGADFANSSSIQDKMEPIAVIGFSMRFPENATTPEGFWEILQNGRSVMTEVPPDRFKVDGFYDSDASRPDTINARGGYFLKEDLGVFDAAFFSITPSEVECMDPQQRLLLETSYHAFENSGIPIHEAAKSKTSVYVGCSAVDYTQMYGNDEEIHPLYRATGSGSALLANRLSWFYDLRGPSMTIETACSGSLVALHLACQSIRSGESKMSLVCGTQLYLEPMSSAISLSSLGFMSPDSRCYSFDHRGNGYAKGEGFGVVVLKPLSDAIAAGDAIRAVIRSTTTNQDGRTPGITQPSQEAQEAQIREAYRLGGLSLDRTRLFEAHGTGTPMGDPIEARAIKNVFQEYRSQESPMYIGALKSNIGHLEAAAGVAGVIKVVMCLEKGIIPANAGYEAVNPRIEAEKWHLRFPAQAVPWPSEGLRRASVNSFGYGGSNAHAVIDDAYHYMQERGLSGHHCTSPQRPSMKEGLTNKDENDFQPDQKDRSSGQTNGVHNGFTHAEDLPYLFVWSTSDAPGIERIGASYKDFLSRKLLSDVVDSEYLGNLAYTLSSKRSILPWKTFLVSQSGEDLQVQLGKLPKPTRSSLPPKLHFVFTGQGAQWATMGLDLMIHPIFRQSLSEAGCYLTSIGCSWSLIAEIEKPAKESRLDEPALAQPICTAIQVALVELLTAWGIRPLGVVGHSSGEIAAAFCAGALTREMAWAIAYHRGSLAGRLANESSKDERGAMMSIQLSESDLKPYFEKLQEGRSVSIGCENSPVNTTVTGMECKIDHLKKLLDEDGVFARKLKIPVAYHSKHMQGIAKEYLALLRPICPLGDNKNIESGMFFVSSVTGQEITLNRLRQPEYWVENLVSRVRFTEAMKSLFSKLEDVPDMSQRLYCIEVGPHAALQRPIKDIASGTKNLIYNSTLRRGDSGWDTLANVIGELFMESFPVEIEAFNSHGLSRIHRELQTDLPSYPFNHSQRYWLESRLFKNYRHRSKPRHELLGLPSIDWNPLKPRWRHTIRRQDSPWLEDHQLNGSVIYPAAGMLCMVIEAARSMAKPDAQIRSYRLREVTIQTALVIPSDSQGVEVQLYLQQQKHTRVTTFSAADCNDFYLAANINDEWKEICSGTIVLDYIEKSKGIYHDEQHVLKYQEDTRARFDEIFSKCSANTPRHRFYDMGKAMGYDFGPTFQTVHNLSYDPTGRHAAGTIILDEWMEKTKKSQVQKHVIHPTALDGILQMVAALNSKGGTVMGPLQAPTQFKQIWVSNQLLSHDPDARVLAAAKHDKISMRDTECSIVSLNSETLEPEIVIEGYRATTLNSNDQILSERQDKIYKVEWKPDIEVLDGPEKANYCLQRANNHLDWDPTKQLVCLYFIKRALDKLSEEGFQSPSGHFKNYMQWMYLHLEYMSGQSLVDTLKWEDYIPSKITELYLSQFAARGRTEKAVVDFCSRIPQIVKGETDPLDILFNQGLANDLYADELYDLMGRRMSAFVELLVHKNPNMNVLEIGAGTGAFTSSVLSTLSSNFNSYAFTDISPSFFEKAKARFAEHVGRMTFKALDIETDPTSQGFEAGKYDVIIAGLVFHATANITETLKHARSLLKPGGYLLMVETTNKHTTAADVVWGTLSGWWRGSENDRKLSPLYTQAEWDKTLRETGFTGLDVALTDYSDTEHHVLSFLVSRAVDDYGTELTVASPVVILSSDTELEQEIAATISSELRSLGFTDISITTPTSVLAHTRTIHDCVSLLELGDPFLTSISEDGFDALKWVIESAERIYWITSGAGSNAEYPEKAFASGFGRAIMHERPEMHFVTIDVNTPTNAARVFRKVFTASLRESNPQESDYMESDGVVLIPRVIKSQEANDFVYSRIGQPELERKFVGSSNDAGDALRLKFTPGQLDSFCFVQDYTRDSVVAPDDLEIHVKATGINFTDVMHILGQITGPSVGFEYSGVVSRIGSSVEGFKPGDRVCGLCLDAFKTYCRSNIYTTVKIPDNLRFTEVFPAVYLTAIYSISHVARLKRGESILIHSAAGAVGQVAIQLAKKAGADIFVTVSSDEKKQLVQQLYGVPENRIFYSRNLSFGYNIMQATAGRGVDVVLNSLAGEALAESWRIVAPLGRFVEIGKRDIHTFQSLQMMPFSKNISFHSVDLETVLIHNPQLMREMHFEMQNLLSDGGLSPPQPVKVFSRGEFESAIRYLQTGHHMGKAVVDWEAESEIAIAPNSKPSYTFAANATYVIAGGLGGIGKSLASWFVGRGARHLVLLSRSGPRSENVQKWLNQLKSAGINVLTPRCDVSDLKSLQETICNAAQLMPPVKGVVQAAMVLRDRMFVNMSREEWQAVLLPKVHGTWNLHNALPREMDFFLILSSLGGMMGSSGQSQYNGASTFQDAFARHRWSLGEKCVSIDIGVVGDVGYVAEHSDVARRWERKGIQVLDEKEIHSLVDWACNPCREFPTSWSTQIITGAGQFAGRQADNADLLPHLKRPIFSPLIQDNRFTESNAASQSMAQKVNYGALLSEAQNIEEAGKIIATGVASFLSNALCVPVEDIDTARTVHSYGVDSLMAVELRFWFKEKIEAETSVFELLANKSILALSRSMASKSKYRVE
ncbi:unnamed protein product [Clonostachys rosea f. rosea IK726]|uniref:Uncharacterized protein n=2 Tax=Bionectria ochroleuca TaxID=29856 RepID=A0A0B7KQX6_BIOOC|nr:unnamed protein product [Clonostachys rosea f. rosea IK726]